MSRQHECQTLESPPTYDVLGIPISQTSLPQAEALITSWAADTRGRFVCVRDVSSLMECRKDPYLTALHDRAALVLPDGMPLAMVGKARGLDVERTSGPDLFERMCASSGRTGLKHFLYGGKLGVAEMLAETLRKRYPDVRIVGYGTPPFRPLTNEEKDAIIADIRMSGADVVWIGISSPKQELLMDELTQHLHQTLIGVGAAFDFSSGAVRRAPLWMRNAGLESLHRLMSEPRRLWRRYLINAPRFLFALAADRRPGKPSTKSDNHP